MNSAGLLHKLSSIQMNGGNASALYYVAVLVLGLFVALAIVNDDDSMREAFLKGAAVGFAFAVMYHIGRRDMSTRLATVINRAQTQHKEEEKQ